MNQYFDALDELNELFQQAMLTIQARTEDDLLPTTAMLKAWANKEALDQKQTDIKERYAPIHTLLEYVELVPGRRDAMAEALVVLAKWRRDQLQKQLRGKSQSYFMSLISAPRGSPTGSTATRHESMSSLGEAEVERVELPPYTELLDSLLETLEMPSMEVVAEVSRRVRIVFEKERNIVVVPAPCVIVGDIHGHWRDLINNVLPNGGAFGSSTYLFLGDYVDRGDKSLLCVLILFVAKLAFPDKVFMIRGNHESRATNTCYGFHAECRSLFPLEGTIIEHPLWSICNSTFESLPLAAIAGERVFCVHGGLSPSLPKLVDIYAMHRFNEIDSTEPVADLTWSDPYGSKGFRPNQRGCGFLFGADASEAFCEANGMDFICRAHQCVKAGFQWEHDGKVLTVFSAANYCGLGNTATILKLGPNLETEIISYEHAAAEESPLSPAQPPGYFQ